MDPDTFAVYGAFLVIGVVIIQKTHSANASDQMAEGTSPPAAGPFLQQAGPACEVEPADVDATQPMGGVESADSAPERQTSPAAEVSQAERSAERERSTTSPVASPVASPVTSPVASPLTFPVPSPVPAAVDTTVAAPKPAPATNDNSPETALVDNPAVNTDTPANGDATGSEFISGPEKSRATREKNKESIKEFIKDNVLENSARSSNDTGAAKDPAAGIILKEEAEADLCPTTVAWLVSKLKAGKLETFSDRIQLPVAFIDNDGSIDDNSSATIRYIRFTTKSKVMSDIATGTFLKQLEKRNINGVYVLYMHTNKADPKLVFVSARFAKAKLLGDDYRPQIIFCFNGNVKGNKYNGNTIKAMLEPDVAEKVCGLAQTAGIKRKAGDALAGAGN